jgi:hypothetical protein
VTRTARRSPWRSAAVWTRKRTNWLLRACSATRAPNGCWPRTEHETDWGLEVLNDPIRLELQDGVTLAYGEKPRAGHDITLRADIEHHNFGSVDSCTPLGWMHRRSRRALFRAVDATGRCAVAALVRSERGDLFPGTGSQAVHDHDQRNIAETDCLFYAVADDGGAIASAAH